MNEMYVLLQLYYDPDENLVDDSFIAVSTSEKKLRELGEKHGEVFGVGEKVPLPCRADIHPYKTFEKLRYRIVRLNTVGDDPLLAEMPDENSL